MNDDDLKVGDHIQVNGVVSFINSRGVVRYHSIGACQVYLCERKKAGFWRCRIYGLWEFEPEVLVHRSAFCELIPGIRSLEMHMKPYVGPEHPKQVM